MSPPLPRGPTYQGGMVAVLVPIGHGICRPGRSTAGHRPLHDRCLPCRVRHLRAVVGSSSADSSVALMIFAAITPLRGPAEPPPSRLPGQQSPGPGPGLSCCAAGDGPGRAPQDHRARQPELPVSLWHLSAPDQQPYPPWPRASGPWARATSVLNPTPHYRRGRAE